MTDAKALFEQFLTEQSQRRLPPVEHWQPEREGHIAMHIARDGTWYYQGSPIRREAMVRLFSTVLRREGDVYFLVTPAEKLAITVEDVPFQAVCLTQDGAGSGQRLLLTTNVGDHVPVDAEHPLRVENAAEAPAPYVQVRAGLEARLSRPVFYELVALSVPAPDTAGVIGVWSYGCFYPLGSV